jgi:hypothetical protein
MTGGAAALAFDFGSGSSAEAAKSSATTARVSGPSLGLGVLLITRLHELLLRQFGRKVAAYRQDA